MRVKSLIKKLKNDPKIYIEFIDKQSFSSYGFYTKNDLVYNDKFNNYNVKDINIQYVDNKRLLVIYI